MAKRKSYNPFKLWGSWVGALILGVFAYGLCIELIWNTCPSFFTGLTNNLTNGYAYIRFVIGSTFGFLVGWGIHSLVRRLK